MSDPVDLIKPWSIKAVATRTQNIATAAARRDNLTVGQWLEKRIDEWEAQGSPTTVGQTPALPPLDPSELAHLMQSMAALAKATDIKPSQTAIRRAYTLVDDLVRETGGMPPRAARLPGAGKANGQALALEGKAAAPAGDHPDSPQRAVRAPLPGSGEAAAPTPLAAGTAGTERP